MCARCRREWHEPCNHAAAELHLGKGARCLKCGEWALWDGPGCLYRTPDGKRCAYIDRNHPGEHRG